MNESTYSYGGGNTSFNDGGSFYSGFGGGSSYQPPQPKVSAPSSYSQSSSFSGPTTKSGAPDMRYTANRVSLGTNKMDGTPDMRFACNRKK